MCVCVCAHVHESGSGTQTDSLPGNGLLLLDMQLPGVM